MKRLVGLLYVAFPAVLLLAQTSPPENPAAGTSTLGAPSVEQLRLMEKRFPPEMALKTHDKVFFFAEHENFSSASTGLNQGKLTQSYCVYPDLDRKSVSVKRCESIPQRFRLVWPFKAAAPEEKPAK